MFDFNSYINNLPASKIFFISDTHFFGGKESIKLFGYPYHNQDEYHQAIINNWNLKIRDDDIIFVLGDVFYAHGDAPVGKKELDVLKQLNGKKVLVLGNHDVNTLDEYSEYFDFISPVPLIIKNFIMLSHMPLFNNGMNPFINIFGHVHNDVNVKDYTAYSYCVCVERIWYTPISLETIIDRTTALR